MRKFLLSLIVMLPLAAFAQQRVVVFHETFGNPTSEKGELIKDHKWDYDTINSGIRYTWRFDFNSAGLETLNVRNNNPSTYAGASGGGNLYFNNDKSNELTIWGINTSKTTDNRFSFGIFGKNEGDANDTVRFKYYLTEDELDTGVRIGADETAALGGGVSAVKVWYLVQNIAIPQCERLRLRVYAKYKSEVRVDDLKITGLTTSGIEEVDQNEFFVITQGNELIVKGGADTVYVYNTLGHLVATSTPDTAVSGLPNGIYFVKCGNKVEKIIL